MFRTDLSWTSHLAEAGFLVVAGCWTNTDGLKVVYCGPGALPAPVDAIGALIEAGREQPGASRARVGLFGFSAGGIEVYEVLSRRHDLRAGAVDSGFSQVDPATITTPILILGGTADPVVPVGAQRQTEEALRAAGRMVESHYYEGATHGVFLDPRSGADATAVAIAFFQRSLR